MQYSKGFAALCVAYLCVMPIYAFQAISSQPGRILFYAPWISKSISIKAMPLIEGLADRGHKVFLVMPYCLDCNNHGNITILHATEYDGEIKALH